MDQAAARAPNGNPQSGTVTKTNPRPNPRPNPKLKPIFVRSEIDDFGLTGSELLVLAHVARREDEVDGCYESVPNIARFLKLSDKTVTRVLMVLNEVGLITEYDQTGDTTTRFINPIEKWIDNKGRLPAIRKRIYPDKSKSKKGATQTSKPITPDTGDGGIQNSTPDTGDGGPRTPEPLLPWTSQQGVPRTPETDKGDPSEGSPSEVNLIKVIPHTQAHDDHNVEEFAAEPTVCVAIPIDICEVRKQYATAHSFPLSRQIKNPNGWLITARDGRYDDLVLNWYREEEKNAERRAALHAQEEAARIQHEKEVAELRAQREKDAAARAEEDQRNAPERERELTEQRAHKEQRDRAAIVAECLRLARLGTNKPDLYAGMIKTMLGDDEQARAEFQQRLLEQSTNADDHSDVPYNPESAAADG